MHYNYLSAGAGAGKTDWAINISKKYNYNGVNVLLIVPTINLCDDIESRSGHRITAIHSRNTDNVAQTISNTFSVQAKTSSPPISIVITEASFLLMSYRSAVEKWVVIKDEAMEPLHITTLKLPDSIDLIKSWFDFLPIASDNKLKELFKIVRPTALCPKTTTVDDGILGEIHRIKHMLSDGNIEVLLNFSNVDLPTPLFQYSAFIKPTLFQDFAEVYMMSANFEHTFLYHQWEHAGVKWQDKTPASMTSIPPSNRVRIHYWSEDGAWSSRRRRYDLQKYIDWFQKREPGTDYIYVANNDQYINLLGTRIPAQSHGLNRWRHHTKFMTCASYLISNGDEAIYQYYGTSTTDARGLRNTQMIYQQLMRTDLRNYSSTSPIEVYVPTLTEARELLLYLPEAQVIDAKKTKNAEITGITGRLKNGWQITWNKEQEAEIPDITYSFGGKSREYLSTSITRSELERLCQDCNLKNNTNRDTYICTDTLVGAINQVTMSKQSVLHGGNRSGSGRKLAPIHPLIQYIISADKKSIAGLTPEQVTELKKNDTNFFITGILPNQSRFLAANIIGNSDVVAFDFDDTEISDIQLQHIFPQVEYLKYTTISDNPKNKKRRFRLVIPCTRAMTIAEHRRLMEYYYSIIQEYDNHGLDAACIKPERKYYMPHLESEITHS
jgi:hypothetical protein